MITIYGMAVPRVCAVALTVLLSVTSSVLAQQPQLPETNARFKVFDGLLYLNKPNLRYLGIVEMRSAGSIWRPGSRTDQVDYVGTRDAVRYVRTFGEPFYLDIERWPVWRVAEDEANRSIAKLTEVADIARRVAPSAQFGIYGVMPQITYWPIILHNSSELKRWRNSNEHIMPLADKVDFVLPSLYTFYNDKSGWEKFATEMLKEARRYGKPVYAFLWPQFHDSNEQLHGQDLPADFWRFQLEFCRQHADGIVLWGGYKQPWNENAAWWLETKRFMATLPSTLPSKGPDAAF